LPLPISSYINTRTQRCLVWNLLTLGDYATLRVYISLKEISDDKVKCQKCGISLPLGA